MGDIEKNMNCAAAQLRKTQISVSNQKKRIFISHPYKNSPDVNKNKTQEICKQVMEDGHLPISPLHLFSFMNDDSARDDIIAWCLDMINLCDEIWVFGDSEGCNIERIHAENNGKVVKLMY